ncbi:MAG: hypothetical protein HC830_06290 [Bacteroidetes bacterium]|nr:hypothetical protein [Bacteroidota bacterium]
MSLIPITFSAEGKAIPLEYHGSAHIHAYIRAEGIMEIPEGISEIKKGALIRVRPL